MKNNWKDETISIIKGCSAKSKEYIKKSSDWHCKSLSLFNSFKKECNYYKEIKLGVSSFESCKYHFIETWPNECCMDECPLLKG